MNGRLAPVVEALCIRTRIWIAGGVRLETDLVFGRQGERFDGKPLFSKSVQGLFGNQTPRGSGGQVNDFSGQSFGHGLKGGKKGCHGLADTGGGLNH
ncbi:MAG: hypothetical protein CSA11_11965 [Chloroflexi bacterium]|nr:MAG: hypothetical protein CSA11_11965 [Chloroflexota bacterium]